MLTAVLLIGATLFLVSPLESRSWPCGMAIPANQQHAGHVDDGNINDVSSCRRAPATIYYYWRGALMRPIQNSVTGPEDMSVAKVRADSPVAEAGLKQGDMVVGFDAMPITTPRSLLLAIADHPGGPVINLLVERVEVGKGITAIRLHVPCAQLDRHDRQSSEVTSYVPRGTKLAVWIEKFLRTLTQLV